MIVNSAIFIKEQLVFITTLLNELIYQVNHIICHIYYQTNMDFKDQQIEPLVKKRLKYHPYHQKSDCQYKGPTPPDGQRYLIELNSIADFYKSLIDIFRIFFTNVYETNPIQANQKRVSNCQNFNAVFKYMIELYHLHDKYISPNEQKTRKKGMHISEILGKQQSDSILKEQVDQFFSRCSQKIENQSLSSHKSNRYQIKEVRRMKSNLIKKYSQYILSLPSQQTKQRRKIYIPAEYQAISQIYIYKLLNKIAFLQFTKQEYRLTKIKHFQKTYESYLQPVLRKKQQKNKPTQLTLKRYTLIRNVKNYHLEEVLINLRSLFQMQKQEVNYKSQYLQMMKQLGIQLKRHNDKTKQFYPLLHPKNIIFNQISLKVHLSYINPLFQALGLLKMPMSVEQMICFAATPQVFDIFSAPNQHLPRQDQRQGSPYQIFYDLHYQMESLLQVYDHKYKNHNLARQINGKSMSEIRLKQFQISQTWRYLMIFSYFMNNQYYFKKMVGNKAYTQKVFKQFLQGEQKKYKKDATAYVKNVLAKTPLQKIELTPSKQMSLSIFDNFLYERLQKPHQQDKFDKTNKFLQQKNILRQNIENLIKQKKNMKNPIKYLLLFYVNLFQSLFHINMLCYYFMISFETGQQVFKSVGDKLTISKFGQVDKKSWVQASYQKLQEYQHDKSKNIKAQQFKLIIKNYEEIYKDASEERSNYLMLRSKMRNIFQLINTQQLKYKLTEIIKQANPIINKCRTYVKDIMNKELKQKDIKMQAFLLKIKIRLFLILTQDNFINLESLVFPMLELTQQKTQQNRQIQQQLEIYKYAQDIIKDYQIKGNQSEQQMGRQENRRP